MGRSSSRRFRSFVDAPASAAPPSAICSAARLREARPSEPPSPTTVSGSVTTTSSVFRRVPGRRRARELFDGSVSQSRRRARRAHRAAAAQIRLGARRHDEREAKRVGDAIGVDWTRFDLEQFRAGMDVEFEHGSHDPQTDVTGNDPIITGKIAFAHMKEFADYYERLERMESRSEEHTSELQSLRHL